MGVCPIGAEEGSRGEQFRQTDVPGVPHTQGTAHTDRFAPGAVAAFIGAQLVGALVGALLTELFYPRAGVPEPLDLPEPVHSAESPAEVAAAAEAADSRS